ncbi:MAG: hypothetical protein H7289_06755 [Mucilaginibacter sp.]|nr:hypothetical protein [Mucilaginibacter sp.]
MQKVELTVEKSNDRIWGRVIYNDNLIIDEATNLYDLQLKIKTLLFNVEGVDPKSVTFDLKYDIPQ